MSDIHLVHMNLIYFLIRIKNFIYKIQSETKAIGQELIYEAKLQNSAWPGRP